MNPDGKFRLTCECGKRFKFSFDSIGKVFTCPQCRRTIDVATHQHNANKSPTAKLNSSDYEEGLIVFRPIWLAAGAVSGVFLGIISSQYFPIREDRIGVFSNAPWDSKRMAGIPFHIFLFAIIGLLLAIVGASVYEYRTKGTRPRRD